MKQLSAQQVKRASAKAFINWYKALGHEKIRVYIHRDQLNRSLIAQELSFSRSSWGSNIRLKKALNGIDNRLRMDKLLPPIKTNTENNLLIRDRNVTKNTKSNQREKSLDIKNSILQAELDQMKEKLREFELYDEFFVETGRLPR